MTVLGLLPLLSSVVTLMSLLTLSVHGQCPVTSRSSAYCSCNIENNNGYRIARSIVCSGLDANTTLVFTDTTDNFVDVIVENSTLDHVIPFMFSRVMARNFIMSDNGILGIDDNAFIGAKDYIESLDLSHNLISTLPPAIFKYLSQLKILNLYNNYMNTIYKSMFEGLASVTYVNLGRNNIFDIRSDAFVHLSNVKTLVLDSNAIEVVNNDSFTGLGRLEILHLTSNKIASIAESAFFQLPNLQSLYLALNDLTFLNENMLRMNGNLEEITFRDNELTSVPENLFFRNKNLKIIDLSFNSLTSIEKFPFKKLGRLENLNLKSNRIKTIYKNVFEDLNSVRNLNLANNDIENLEENGLAGLAVAETVRLDNNRIYIIPYGVFDAFGNVQYLNLSMNRIEHFEDTVPFLANHMLEELDLSWNKIKEVPDTLFEKTRALRKLIMAHNEISVLYPDCFVNIPNLEELDLSYNRLNAPVGNLFYNCGKLRTLKLSWNPLQELSRSFLVGLKDLEEVMLDHSCLRNLPNDFFTPVDDSVNATTPLEFQQPSPLSNLRVAHLDSNFIENLNSTHLKGAAGLTTLTIQENNMTSVDPELFRILSSLNVINISRNALGSSVQSAVSRMTSVKVLDISYNRIEEIGRRMLETDTSFDELYLAGNPITCNCNMAFLRVYEGLKDHDTLQCGPSNNGLEGEMVVCYSITALGCSHWPSNHHAMCAAITTTDLKYLSEASQKITDEYERARADYENFCIVHEDMTTSAPIILNPNNNNSTNIDLPEIIKITLATDSNSIRVEWMHTDTSLVSGYRLRYTNSSDNVTTTSKLISDRLWYVINNTKINEYYFVCVEMVLLDGQVRLDQNLCKEVRDLVVKKVTDDSGRSGLIQLLVPIIAVASVLLIIVLIIVGVRISLRRKRHRDKQNKAMTAEQKMGMWDFPFQPHITEELVEQTILPYDVYSEAIVDTKFHLKKLRATIRGYGKTKRVQRRKSRGRQIPSVAGSMRSATSKKSDSMNSIHSNNSMDDVDNDLFISSQGRILPPPYSESTTASVGNGSLKSISIMGNGSRKSSMRGSQKSSANGSVKAREGSVKSNLKGSMKSKAKGISKKGSAKAKRNSGYDSDKCSEQ